MNSFLHMPYKFGYIICGLGSQKSGQCLVVGCMKDQKEISNKETLKSGPFPVTLPNSMYFNQANK